MGRFWADVEYMGFCMQNKEVVVCHYIREVGGAVLPIKVSLSLGGSGEDDKIVNWILKHLFSTSSTLWNSSSCPPPPPSHQPTCFM